MYLLTGLVFKPQCYSFVALHIDRDGYLYISVNKNGHPSGKIVRIKPGDLERVRVVRAEVFYFEFSITQICCSLGGRTKKPPKNKKPIKNKKPSKNP